MQAQPRVILEGDLGEKVSLNWLNFPYLELREKWKRMEYIGKSNIWTKNSPWKLSQNFLSESSRVTPEHNTGLSVVSSKVLHSIIKEWISVYKKYM